VVNGLKVQFNMLEAIPEGTLGPTRNDLKQEE
jgi:hypothetical protein